MRRIAIGLVGLLVGVGGCSKSSDTTVDGQKSPAGPPDVAVREFLESIRVGDHKKAEGMLTDLAREKTAQADLMVAPPGSPTAKFEIVGTHVVDNSVAHVGSLWTDIGEDGKPQSNEFVWACRLEPQGWRIAGVAVELFPNQPPLLLDFEDPADMLRKQQMAEAEMQRQMNGGQAGAQTAGAAGMAPGTVLPNGATQPNGGVLLNGATQPNVLTGAPGNTPATTGIQPAAANDPFTNSTGNAVQNAGGQNSVGNVSLPAPNFQNYPTSPSPVSTAPAGTPATLPAASAEPQPLQAQQPGGAIPR